MPPKGWRKNADGSYPLPSREREIKSIDEILFPKSTVLKLAKSVFPPGTLISKESAEVLQRCATVYVNYITEYARNIAGSKDRVTVTANDVLEAFYSVGLDEFIETMRNELEQHTKIQEAKKLEKAKQKAQKVDTGDVVGDSEEAEQERNDDNDDDDDNVHNDDEDDEDEDEDEDEEIPDVVESDDEENHDSTHNIDSLEKEYKELVGNEPSEAKNDDTDDETDNE
ncbi:DNA polymerase epsilon noncatalytic subunit [Saccharomycopsis crataegensis]|uniref:DNA polymerase epsilon subunit D n=1 Tax=Saccharomycopsis crataegensis TaxID=43959 RepID=A0AAV5QQ72_9ASCO|nr:DNA polymerase epsilon noncatalytic subunit [Saccharomycopsis crataegensis]